MPLGEEITVERGHQINFTAINSSSMRTVADIDIDLLLIITRTADELSGGTDIDDIERP